MVIQLQQPVLSGAKSDLVAVPVEQDSKLTSENLYGLPEKILKKLIAEQKRRNLKFARGESVVLETSGEIHAARIAFIGIGNKEKLDAYAIRAFSAVAYREAEKLSAKSLVLFAPQKIQSVSKETLVFSLAMGLHLTAYRFDKYLSAETKKNIFRVQEVMIAIKDASNPHYAALLKRAGHVAEGVAAARDAVNEPGSVLFPQALGEFAMAHAKKVPNLKISIWDEKRLIKEKMMLLYNVGKGAQNQPRLIVLEYKPTKPAKNNRKVILVGKGLTFDTGGVNLKPTPGGQLEIMKMDKGGGAAVIGAMLAIARLAPSFPVIGLVPSAQNALSGSSYLPGDVITGRKGLSVEVNNTDAEGRLILADALSYASEMKPSEILDCATLTGACMVALGMYTTGLFSHDDGMAQKIRTAGEAVGEDIWRLPLTPKLAETLKTPIADAKNSGGRFGGAISAAHFLNKFVGDKIKWAHLDIAGPAFTEQDYDYYRPGGTGVITETLIEYVVPHK